MLQFKNADVAAKYKSSFKGDPMVHQPGKKATGFQCKLSQINLEQADKLFSVKNQNLLDLNDTKPGGKLREINTPKPGE